MADVKDQVLAFVKSAPIEESARVFDLPPSRIKRWISGERAPGKADLQNWIDYQKANVQEAQPEGVAGIPVARPALRGGDAPDIDDKMPIMQRKALEAGVPYVPHVPLKKQLADEAAARVIQGSPKEFNPLPVEFREELDTIPPEGAVPTKVASKGPKPLTEAEYKAQMAAARMPAPQQAKPNPPQTRVLAQPVSRPTEEPVISDDIELVDVSEPVVMNSQGLDQLRDQFFNWKSKEVCILMPFQKTTNPCTAFALIAAALDLGKDRVEFKLRFNDAIVNNVRNRLADDFLNHSKANWALFIDDDIIPPIGRPAWWKAMTYAPASYPDKLAGMHFVERLLSHKKTVVGATYYGRNPQGPPMFHEAMHDREAHMAARHLTDALRPTNWVGTGLLLVHRSVFKDIMAKMPELAPVTKPRDVNSSEPNRPEWDFFRMPNTAGEDVAFCNRVRACGHQVYVDTGLQCAHVGPMAFTSWSTSNNI